MKKLALALVCLVSVAFLASCDPTITNPEPQIVAETGNGLLVNNQVVDLGVEYPYAFRASSNAQTLKPLSRMEVSCAYNDQVFVICDTTITGTEFLFEGVVYFEQREIVGSAEIIAKVTDAAGQVNTASIKVDLNKEEALVLSDLNWVRRGNNLMGNTETEMATLGLKWTGSHKEVFATIEPLNENCRMWVRPGEEFETVDNETEKAAYFADLIESQPITTSSYRNITCNNSADYNDVLAVIAEDGFQYLIHITHATIETGSYGTQITITGQFK